MFAVQRGVMVHGLNMKISEKSILNYNKHVQYLPLTEFYAILWILMVYGPCMDGSLTEAQHSGTMYHILKAMTDEFNNQEDF